jgi:quinol monooxygenase YgiN
MSKTVRFAVNLTIHEGKFDEFTGIAQAMIASTRKEPGALGYDWYFSSDRKRCRLLETYTDAAAVQAHIAGHAVQDLVPKMLEVSTIAGFEVFGDPGPEAAKILTGLGAEIFPLWRGLEQ